MAMAVAPIYFAVTELSMHQSVTTSEKLFVNKVLCALRPLHLGHEDRCRIQALLRGDAKESGPIIDEVISKLQVLLPPHDGHTLVMDVILTDALSDKFLQHDFAALMDLQNTCRRVIFTL